MVTAGLVLRSRHLAAPTAGELLLLDAAERTQAAAMVPAAAERFLAGRVAQRHFVAELLRVQPTELAAAYHCPTCGNGAEVNHGRPGYQIAGEQAPLALSTSRAAGWILLAAVLHPGPGVRLGVDIEDPAATSFAGFGAVALTAAERDVLAPLAGSALLAAQARLWARKEAWLKMTGQGLLTPPAEVDVLARPGLRDLSPAETGLPAFLAAAVVLHRP
ncbi:4'-phosphopantetheinyl transferase superfamily protein [Arthrobacter ulcerisalmonis]|uniref:4'-phosphopantetheinyl transferase superfamily protein n=1 Tax=Arthrobacter ulcerisalmonis TaxID=2483813 RepID=A0A3P5XP13_9MICC|nr:4'-phosphopantetheinyl transferase superfamily protein [Arthrobacter ulcerisalmonis]VDC30497.1 4'-phosphopantetheinyl transferase superfamily protein [Arthrobacter ulcerisalmonis]